jgi:uncharacterized protein YbcC (UPF0753/DUF2309 family)
MKTQMSSFNEHTVLHDLKHYLPTQAPLKDFIHHNTLHAFQTLKFEKGIRQASEIFGYKVSLSLTEYRQLYALKKINGNILEQKIIENKGIENLQEWKNKLLTDAYDTSNHPRIGQLRLHWKKEFHVDLDLIVQPELFRVLGSYLDQGISIWNFPVSQLGFLSSIREMEKNTFSSFFSSPRAKKLLFSEDLGLVQLLKIIVGDESLYEQYLFDQQFSHAGWSGMVSVLEDQPETLLDRKKITLHDLLIFELLLEINALDTKFGETWSPLANVIEHKPTPLFAEIQDTELNDLLAIWQDAYEWTYYDEVLAGLHSKSGYTEHNQQKSFQALFCIDDRECSIRRYVEKIDPQCETFGTPGFFGIEFYFKPEHGKFTTKVCPAPLTPKYLIKELETTNKRKKDAHYTKRTHSLFQGLLISQTLGFWSAIKLFLNIFRPTITAAASSSFKHMDRNSVLTIENKNPNDVEDNLQVGFTIEEMANRVEGLLMSIGLVKNFAPIVYVIGHGASSVNNTHYAGYDCGACSGRPGSVNARVISFMANHQKVREVLNERGIIIPKETQFVGALHDTTRDELEFYDESNLLPENQTRHKAYYAIMQQALDLNAKERSRRFESVNSRSSLKKVHDKVKLRSVSLFEPRPELNHATNTLCIIGSRELTKHLFLDRRAFMNSYDYKIDLDGKYLFNVIKPIGPVCGGINLEYYFSRVDNYKLGAGTKLPHNVMGLIGVANGIDGDLRPGLPLQMIEVHDPIRLMVIVEHYPEVVLKTIQILPATYEWFINEWVHLTVINPDTKELFVFKDGQFKNYTPLKKDIQPVNDFSKLMETEIENLPVYTIQ